MQNNNLISIELVSTLSILLIAIASLTISVYAEEDENATDSDMSKFFAIQHAQSGSITQNNETTYSLELNDVSDKTILFSDRPDRIVKTESTLDFIGNWSIGADSFTFDAPNGVLIVDEIEEQQDNVIIELFSPIQDVDKKELKYEITSDNGTFIDLPNEIFGESTLVIDSTDNKFMSDCVIRQREAPTKLTSFYSDNIFDFIIVKMYIDLSNFI